MSLDLVGLTSQEERDTLTIDEQVSLAFWRIPLREGHTTQVVARLGHPTFDQLPEEGQSQIRSLLRVYDLYCIVCGDPGRAYLPPDVTSWTCPKHITSA